MTNDNWALALATIALAITTLLAPTVSAIVQSRINQPKPKPKTRKPNDSSQKPDDPSQKPNDPSQTTPDDSSQTMPEWLVSLSSSVAFPLIWNCGWILYFIFGVYLDFYSTEPLTRGSVVQIALKVGVIVIFWMDLGARLTTMRLDKIEKRVSLQGKEFTSLVNILSKPIKSILTKKE
jgi:hypothetical protein